MTRIHMGDRHYDGVPPLVDLDIGYGDIHIQGLIEIYQHSDGPHRLEPGLVSLHIDADHPLSPLELQRLPWARFIESAIARSVGKPYRGSLLDD